MTVDWRFLLVPPQGDVQRVFDGLNNAECTIMSKHNHEHKSLAEAFEESLEEWIDMLPLG